jgi:hypothetical protein
MDFLEQPRQMYLTEIGWKGVDWMHMIPDKDL